VGSSLHFFTVHSLCAIWPKLTHDIKFKQNRTIPAMRLCSPLSTTDTQSEVPRFELWPVFLTKDFIVHFIKKYAAIKLHIRPLPLPPINEK
jgi:hypothetical protein